MIPGMLPPIYGVRVTPGAQTYSVPGSYTFTVPNYDTITVDVKGPGGGGGGGGAINANGSPGSAGANSQFGSSTPVRATSGGGGPGGDGAFVTPGSNTWTPGTYSFVVPLYNTLYVEVVGPGGGGGGGANGASTQAANGRLSFPSDVDLVTTPNLHYEISNSSVSNTMFGSSTPVEAEGGMGGAGGKTNSTGAPGEGGGDGGGDSSG